MWGKRREGNNVWCVWLFHREEFEWVTDMEISDAVWGFARLNILLISFYTWMKKLFVL